MEIRIWIIDFSIAIDFNRVRCSEKGENIIFFPIGTQ